MSAISPASGHALRRRILRIGGSALMMIVITIGFLLPFMWIISSGFKSQTTIFRDIVPISWRTFLPVDGTLENFVVLFTEKGSARPSASIIVSAVEVGGALVVCLAAYA